MLASAFPDLVRRVMDTFHVVALFGKTLGSGADGVTMVQKGAPHNEHIKHNALAFGMVWLGVI